MCIDIGTLRAYWDDELSPPQRAAVAGHLKECEACRDGLVRISALAAETSDVLDCLAPGPAETVTPAVALRAWRERAAVQPSLWQRFRGGFVSMSGGSFLRSWRAAVASLAVLAVVLSLAFTPVGSAAGELLKQFRAEQFAPVTIDPSFTPENAKELNPEDFGTFEARTEPTNQQVASLSEAQGLADFPVRGLQSVPAGLSTTPEMNVSTPAEAAFTFNRAKSTAALANMGIKAQLPDELDGATVRVYVPLNVQQVYAGPEGSKSGLLFAQGKSPTLEMPAVLDTPEMRDLFFALSGMPPEVVDQLRAITSSDTTVPVPVLKGDTSRSVEVDGVQGLLVTHKPATTGIEGPEGTYVVWQKNGVVYVLGGTVSETDLLQAANSLQP
ncbi:MAG: anti-sigma factor family protein [Chloroflexota bacterium]